MKSSLNPPSTALPPSTTSTRLLVTRPARAGSLSTESLAADTRLFLAARFSLPVVPGDGGGGRLNRSLVVCELSSGGGGGGGGESGAEDAGDELGVEKADDGVVDPSEACGLSVFIVLLDTRLALSPLPSSSPLPLPSARPPPPEELDTGLALLQSSSLRRRKSSRLTGLTPSTNSSCRSSKTSTTRSHGVESDPPRERTVDRIVSSENELGGREDRIFDSVEVGSVEPRGGGGVGEGEDGREAEARGI